MLEETSPPPSFAAEASMDRYYWKLTETDLKHLQLALCSMLTREDVEKLIADSLSREPQTFVMRPERVCLNKAQTIWVQGIHYTGQTHPDRPHYFIAEITHTTTRSAFSRWLNKNRLWFVRRKLAHTY